MTTEYQKEHASVVPANGRAVARPALTRTLPRRPPPASRPRWHSRHVSAGTARHLLSKTRLRPRQATSSAMWLAGGTDGPWASMRVTSLEAGRSPSPAAHDGAAEFVVREREPQSACRCTRCARPLAASLPARCWPQRRGDGDIRSLSPIESFALSSWSAWSHPRISPRRVGHNVNADVSLSA